MEIKNVSFIGLGVMGYPMAGYLQKNQLEVSVYNRTLSKSQKWIKEHNGKFISKLSEIEEQFDFVINYKV